MCLELIPLGVTTGSASCIIDINIPNAPRIRLPQKVNKRIVSKQRAGPRVMMKKKLMCVKLINQFYLYYCFFIFASVFFLDLGLVNYYLLAVNYFFSPS